MSRELSNIFGQVEKEFIQHMHEKYKKIDVNVSLCCNEGEEDAIIYIAKIIKEIQQYEKLSFRDIFLTLIFTYYSLSLNEQSKDWLDTGFLQGKASNKKLVYDLFYDITIGNIIVNDSNLSSYIRRSMFGLRPINTTIGGKKSIKRKKRLKKYKKRRTIKIF